MREKIFLIILILFFLNCKQSENIDNIIEEDLVETKIQQTYYFNDVDVVEFLTLNFCVDDNGNTKKVAIVPEKTSYKNEKNIKSIIEIRQNLKQDSNSKLKNNCFDYTYEFVNSKYENKHLDESKHKDYENLKEGFFKYNSIVNPNIIIERNKDIQIEKSDKWIAKYKIEWPNEKEYILTYLEINDDRHKYLIGEKIYVEIIDILENGDYVYKSNLLDRTFNVGVISKIK